MNDERIAAPCPRCLKLARAGRIRGETVMPLPKGAAAAPLARDGSGPCCLDCGAADGLLGLGMTFAMARVAVGNDRQGGYRLPGIKLGLILAGRMRPAHDTLEEHQTWLDRAVPDWRELEAR